VRHYRVHRITGDLECLLIHALANATAPHPCLCLGFREYVLYRLKLRRLIKRADPEMRLSRSAFPLGRQRHLAQNLASPGDELNLVISLGNGVRAAQKAAPPTSPQAS
jgi:hypothetical protein